VFDLTDKESLLELEHIHMELKKDFAQRNKPLVAILVGNKYDLLVGMDMKNHEYMNSMAEVHG
jgi:GTPase SAR1 family protein